MVVLDIPRSLDSHDIDQDVAQDDIVLVEVQVFLVELAEHLFVHESECWVGLAGGYLLSRVLLN